MHAKRVQSNTQAEGGKGGRMDMGHGSGSSGGWRVAGGGKVQVDDDPRR